MPDLNDTMNRDPIDLDAAPARAGTGARALAALLLVACGALLWWHARQLQFFCDDSYISYRYSQNFAAGHGLVYNLGERIEGYTNFLWVVMLGGLMKLGLAVEPASLWLGVAFLLGGLVLTFVEGRRLFESPAGVASPAFAAVPVALLVCQGPIVLWSISGLESGCFAAMTLAALVVCERGLAADRTRWLAGAGALYAISTMVRPDGVIFGGAAGLHLVLSSLLARPLDWKGGLRRGLALALGFAALFGPFLLWRHSYYDDWLPNTFYVKAGGRANAELGFAYFSSWLREYPLTAALALLGLLAALFLPRWRAQRSTFLHHALAIALFCAYVIWAGGDYMALYRFVVPILPLCALLATAALVSAYEWLARVTAPKVPRLLLAPVALLLLASGGYALWLPSVHSIEGIEFSKCVRTVRGMRSNTIQWVLAGKAIHDQLPAEITIATTAAGALPFFAEQRCIDQSGLCDRYTAKVSSDPWFLDRAGHMKQATRKHLAELKPEAIFWHPMIETPAKAPNYSPPTSDYELRALRVPGLEEEGRALWFWARKDVADAWKSRGVITKEEAKSTIRPARSAEGEGTKGAGGKSSGGGATKESGAGGNVAANAGAPPPRPAGAAADFTVPRPASGRFLTRRLHEIDPAADEVRASVDDVTRPLWGASGSADVTLSGLPGSAIEFELASAGGETVLPGARAPKSVELRFEANGASLELPLQLLPATSYGPRAWKRYRADASAAKGAGRLRLRVDDAPAGAGSSWIVSSPRLLDTFEPAAGRNVLIITVDTLRADYLGCYGHDRPTSPNLDVLAKSSVLFERCVSQASWTLPSYSSIFTGLFCETHGVVRRDNKLGFAQVTFVEELARAGYATGAVVSGTFTDSFWGFDQGFDDYDDLGMVVDETDLTGSHAKGGASPVDPAAMHGGPELRITSQEVAEKAIHWLDAHRDRRFCLFAHFFDPHDAFVPHPGISERFPPRPVGPDFPNPNAAHDEATDKLRALYEGEIAYTDQWIGKLLEHLSTLRLWDDTIVVVCADHGEEFKERGDDDQRNVSHGSSLFNEQVHVPLLIRVPGTAQKRVVGVVGNLDLGPTLLELAGAKPGGEWQPQGRSLVAMLGDAAASRGEPVLSALFRQYIPDTKPDARSQVWFRVDRGDDAAIEFDVPGPKRARATYLFDWVKNPLQDLRQNLADAMGTKLEELLGYYRTLRPSLVALEKEASGVEIDATQEEILKRLGYINDPTDVDPPQVPVAPAANDDPNKKSGEDDPKKDGGK